MYGPPSAGPYGDPRRRGVPARPPSLPLPPFYYTPPPPPSLLPPRPSAHCVPFALRPPPPPPQVHFSGPLLEHTNATPPAPASPATAERVLALLLRGAVIGLLRGRQEVGPVPMGHRSAVALPRATAAGRVMALAHARGHAVPVAAPAAALPALFRIPRPATACPKRGPKRGSGPCAAAWDPWVLPSPYQMLRPHLQPHAARRYPALDRHRGRVALQSVAPEADPWLHALLVAVGNATGLALLVLGPLAPEVQAINSVAEGARLLAEGAVDHLVVDETLYQGGGGGATRLIAGRH